MELARGAQLSAFSFQLSAFSLQAAVAVVVFSSACSPWVAAELPADAAFVAAMTVSEVSSRIGATEISRLSGLMPLSELTHVPTRNTYVMTFTDAQVRFARRTERRGALPAFPAELFALRTGGPALGAPGFVGLVMGDSVEEVSVVVPLLGGPWVTSDGCAWARVGAKRVGARCGDRSCESEARFSGCGFEVSSGGCGVPRFAGVVEGPGAVRVYPGSDGCAGIGEGWSLSMSCGGSECVYDLSPSCGNGVVDTPERCDDGNLANGDGCSEECELEEGWACVGTECKTTCGDGVKGGAEECDDGNAIDGDGCDRNCTATRCGNAITFEESCDDGNADAGDGCNAACELEEGWACEGSVCRTTCGDWLKVGAEECDDGNGMDGDGCDRNCTATRCGNGVTFGEGCDDGNVADGDGCSAGCALEEGWLCRWESCVPICGDGVVVGPEPCDDGYGTACEEGCGDMAKIPTGPFLMGCNRPPDTSCGDDEALPARTIWLDEYAIDETEVTVSAYRECVDAGWCNRPEAIATACNWGAVDRDEHPVNCVTWVDAEDYCAWVGKRLPTEAEWEKAARGPDGLIYPWGNEVPTCEYAVMSALDGPGCGLGHTAAVRSKPQGRSEYGVYDLSGNVWEWVSDRYDADYTKTSTDTNPPGPATGGSFRVLRGGGWNVESWVLRASGRGRNVASYRDVALGFRCARRYF
ncbi:MAG: SUMF1/EgtB/PvdO family nonheme iron enzyme [Deltaproteobacteria bacterium]|nr:SUMF1/EgtB/PvdO family nonheme iron enzyme [Deltaproteobacteria bacterium]